ncbi:hypothetical protein BgAZ_400290 [Babesia gibsoni]|uniref:TOG domain-containing protein n=1 Tax=Babesia gibsoni TaxID=33632 RepID=A0AAD8LJI8_BABGI|nr:hypothetical protein BgAZ_400290 [Babesia gibsoni]
MAAQINIKSEAVSVALPTRLPDPAELMCRKLKLRPTLSLSELVYGTDVERAEKIQLYTLRLAECHQSERCDLASDGEVFCELLRTGSTPLQVLVCELLTAYIKALNVDVLVTDNEEGIRSAAEIYAFYTLIHDAVVKHALPNLRAGEQVSVFLCNVISTCSSRLVFTNIVNLFASSVKALLPGQVDGEMQAEVARQIIGIMKTLFHLTKAFGAPPAPSKELCDIASYVICATRAHLCRLYSYNVIAFLLRKVSDKDAVQKALPTLTEAQVNQVIALLKEANHLQDTCEWSFQYMVALPVEQFATPMKPDFSRATPPLETKPMVSPPKEVLNNEHNISTPIEMEKNGVDSNKTAVASTVGENSYASTIRMGDTKKTPTIQTNRAEVKTREQPVVTPTKKESTGANTFKQEWVRMLVTQFSNSGPAKNTAEYDREAWKAKSQVLTNVVEQIERLPGKFNAGQGTGQLINVLENILKNESAIPIISTTLRFIALLLEKLDDNLTKAAKTTYLFDLVYERLKDSNNKVQSAAIACVAWMITRSDGSINVEPIKKALSHNSPFARIAMCSIISGSTELPENACNIAVDLQGVKCHLKPMIDALLTDKNVKVRNAAVECSKALENPGAVKARVKSTPAKPTIADTPTHRPLVRRHGGGKKEDLAPTGEAVEGGKKEKVDKEAADSGAEEQKVDKAPTKRRLVRRFLKGFPRKKNKPHNEDTVASETRQVGNGNENPVDMQVDAAPTQTSPEIIVDEPSQSDTVPHYEAKKEDAISEEGRGTPAFIEETSEVNQQPSPDVQQRPSVTVMETEVHQPPENATDNKTPQTRDAGSIPEIDSEPSPTELALRTHIPESILSKIAKRGPFRRCLPDGLFELWAWIQDNLEVATTCETQILMFVSECTNGFREMSKTGKAAVYSFLEDFVKKDLSQESLEILVKELVSNIGNQKMVPILTNAISRSNVNDSVVKLLECNKVAECDDVYAAVLKIVHNEIVANGVGNLSESTVEAITRYCSDLQRYESDVSQLADNIITLLTNIEEEPVEQEPERSSVEIHKEGTDDTTPLPTEPVSDVKHEADAEKSPEVSQESTEQQVSYSQDTVVPQVEPDLTDSTVLPETEMIPPDEGCVEEVSPKVSVPVESMPLMEVEETMDTDTVEATIDVPMEGVLDELPAASPEDQPANEDMHCDVGVSPIIHLVKETVETQVSPIVILAPTVEEDIVERPPTLISADQLPSSNEESHKEYEEAEDLHVTIVRTLGISRMETVAIETTPHNATAEENLVTARFSERFDEEEEEEYGHYPQEGLKDMEYKCTLVSGMTEQTAKEQLEAEVCEKAAILQQTKLDTCEIGNNMLPEALDVVLPNVIHVNEVAMDTSSPAEALINVSLDSTGNRRPSPFACSLAAASARSSISKILTDSIKSKGLEPSFESSELLERYMKLVETIISDCSYIASFCFLSNYQDYRVLLPSLQDEGMVESCTERAQRILENLTILPDRKIIQIMSPFLLDVCHVSILRLCREVESLPQHSARSDIVVEAIVYLIELFTIASGKLYGQALLLYCAVVIHCLALPKYCFQRNIKLYNGLSRLISVNALEQHTDVIARLLVVSLELSAQSLRRGDGGRILMAMLRLTKILQSQITIQLRENGVLSAVSRTELRKSNYTYVSLLLECLRGSTCKSTLEPRLHDAVHHANALLHSLSEVET